MNVACTLDARRGVADPDAADEHVASCLRCQVEAIRYRHLLRRLGAMREEVIEAPVGLHPSVMARLSAGEDDHRKPIGREAAVAAAGLAAVAGAVALWRRSLSA